MSPFKALYGYSPPHPAFPSAELSSNSEVNEYLHNRDLLRDIVKEALQKAQERMKIYADKRRTDRQLQEGEWAYLKLQPYRQSSVALRKNLKLSPKYYGPFEVIKRIGQVAYKLALPPDSKIHPIFHISQLKPQLGKKHTVCSKLPITGPDGSIPMEPLAILDTRSILQKGKPITQKLVHWSNSEPTEATWEDATFLAAHYNILEDKD
ncbi:hypothetical protein ACHQM5_020904 [Ranunculus cassubicifolius]